MRFLKFTVLLQLVDAEREAAGFSPHKKAKRNEFLEGNTEDIKVAALGSKEVYDPYSRNQVLFDLWLTQLLTEEKQFNLELINSSAFRKFLLKLNPKADVGLANRYAKDNLQLMFKRMKSDVKELLEKDMAEAQTVVYVPQLWFNPVTLNTFVLSRLQYVDKEFNKKMVFLDLQKVKDSYPKTLASTMDKHFKHVPGIKPKSIGKFVYSPISGALSEGIEKMKMARLNVVSISAILNRYYTETLAQFPEIHETFQKADNLLNKMKTRPFYANQIFLKAEQEKLKIPAWKPARSNQLRVLLKLAPILTKTARPQELPVEDFFTNEELELFERLFEVEKEFQDLMDYLKTEPTLANGE